MARRLSRQEIPEEQTWNLTDLYPTREAWEADLDAVVASVGTVTKYQGHLGESAAVLHACLDAYEEVMKRGYRVYTYAGLRAAEDGTNEQSQGDEGRVMGAFAQITAALSFIRSELLALPAGTVERYLASEPKLESHRRYLSKLLQEKPHVLSPETEVALASLGEVLDAPYMIYGRAKLADMQFGPAADSQGNELPVSFAVYEDKLELSADTTLRRNAFASFVSGLENYKNTLAATFATEVKKNVVLARLRKYESATHMLLQPQEVSLDAYNLLLDTIQQELAPHMRRYARLRKRVLGLDKMLYCDIEAPLDPGYNPQIEYAEVEKLIVGSLSVLGDDYRQLMERGLRERWVDRVDNVGKATGAFCATAYGVHPYVLMTFTGAMRGAFTLAHELGHGGHFVLTERNQRFVNTEPSLFFVEAPSTCNELLLAQHVLKSSTDPRMRRWVLMQTLQTYHHNFVRHLLEGELQRRIYALAEKGAPVTAATLCSTKGDILEQFWGGEVVIDDGARLTWMRQPHYYLGLYPYTYSAGLTLATAVAQAIREEGQPAVDRWLKTLSAGGSLPPLELAKLAGVDMSGPAPIRKAVAYVGSLVDELEKSF